MFCENQKKLRMNIYFYSNQGDIYCLKSVIKTEISDNNDVLCKIVDEKLWKKPQKSVSSKKMLTDFQNIEPIQIRSGNEIYLMEDVSMMIAHNKKNKENITISNFYPIPIFIHYLLSKISHLKSLHF